MLLIVALFLPIGALWIFETTWMRDRDVIRYRQLIEERQIASSKNRLPTSQHRKGVKKDIWFAQDTPARLHYEIFSEKSLLTLTPVGHHFEILESLEGIRCWMQDQLLTDDTGNELKQQARLICAEKGTYNHTSHEFNADDAHLSLFRLPGHTLPNTALPQEQAYLNGIARNISFVLGKKTPKFQANQFQAKVVRE